MECNAYLGFENVGQGLFYSGLVKLGHKAQFSFVYDCGSNSREEYINDSINSFRGKLNNKLDILIISHFHEDHVNKVEDLIKKVHVRKVVLPYINWIERLTIYLKTNSSNQDYNSFITDPIQYFINPNFEIVEIVVIGAPDKSASSINDIRPFPIEPISSDQFSTEIESEIIIESLGEKRGVSPGDPYLDNFTFSSEIKNKVSFYTTPFAFSINPFWEFQFYLLESGNKGKMDLFQNEVEQLLKKERIHWRDLFTEKYREILRKIYHKFYGNLNQTSLILYHAPIKDVSIYLFEQSNVPPFLRDIYKVDTRKGTLLTGDIKMSSDYLLKEIQVYFSRYWNEVGVFLVPHHGAKANWNFKHPNDLESFEIYVISAGMGRKHHPSLDVIQDIIDNCAGDYFLCNEFNPYSYSMRFRI